MEQIITALVLLFLGVEAIVDYRKKTVSLYAGIAMIIPAVPVNIISGRISMTEMALGGLTGAAVLAAGMVSCQKIGFGDGLILAVIGVWMGGFISFMTLAAGSTIASIVLMALLAAGRIKKGGQVAFVPFLLAGFTGVVLFV